MSVDKDTLVLFRFQNGIQKDECGHAWTSTNIQETSKNTKSGFGITTNSRDGRLCCENPGFYIGGADFTIDYWLYDVHNGDGYRNHFSLDFGGYNDIIIDYQMPDTSATTYNLRCNSYAFTAFTFPGIFASLKHYAFVYEHTKKIITMYVDGKKNASSSVEIARKNVANITLLNHFNNTDNVADTGAVMSAFRISNCARWTSNFDAGGANVA